MEKDYRQINKWQVLAITAMHLAPLAVFWTGTKPLDWIIFGVLYLRIFFITGVYHRYFSHKAYKTSRWFQFLLALGATSSAQRGVLWWAAHHRHHHQYSDSEEDIHSPIKGFIWSHIGWTLDDRYTATDYNAIKDFAKYPELVWLNKHAYVVWGGLGLITYIIGGLSTFLIGFVLSTIVISHVTFFINSLAHVFGSRRYATTDTSKNNWLLAFLAFGEGWHNNHHHFPSSARNGFKWWEIDITYYLLKVLSWCGLVWGLRPVPEKIEHMSLLVEGHEDVGERLAVEKRRKHFMPKNPMWDYLTHALVSLSVIIMLVLLVVFGALNSSAAVIVGVSLFGAALLCYFGAKIALYYLPHAKKAWKSVREMDAVMIFFLLAAAYTPIFLSLPTKGWGWSLFGVSWGIALFALTYRLIVRNYGLFFYGFITTALVSVFVLSVIQIKAAFTGQAISLLGLSLFGFLFYHYVKPALPIFRMQPAAHLGLLLAVSSHFFFLIRYVVF